MNDQPSRGLDPNREAKVEALRRALIEGEESGDAGPLDMADIKRKARELALARALQDGLDSGDAEDFDIDEWLDERRSEAGEAA